MPRQHHLPAATLALAGLLSVLPPVARADLPDFKSIIRDSRPAVVSISTVRAEDRGAAGAMPFPEGRLPPGFEEFQRRFGGPREPGGARSLGSGFLISADGEILTNAHVVDGASSIVVKLADDTEKPARVLGVDKATDIALLKIDARGLPTVKLGDSNGVEVGDWVLAIGSPFGLDYTVTQGIVSAVGRSLPDGTYVPFIQTDVAVNPGSSGGPLLNTRGEVIGINSQIYSRSGGYMGLSFAIPANVAQDVARQLAATGSVERGWLGVSVQALNAELARSFGLTQPRGALVGQVDPGGPAARAGLRAGDVILAYDGRPVANASALPPLVGTTRPGTRVPMAVWRDGREQALPVTIARLAPPVPTTPVAARQDRTDAIRAVLNLQVAPLPEGRRADAGIAAGGVLVVGVGEGPAAAAGVIPGDIILQLGRRPVASPEQLAGLARQLPRGEPVPLLVQRDGGRLFLPLIRSS